MRLAATTSHLAQPALVVLVIPHILFFTFVGGVAHLDRFVGNVGWPFLP